MRRNHMDFLKHQRDDTVRRGIRGREVQPARAASTATPASSTGSVAGGADHFCVSCHSYAAVKIDCFECHASKPKATAALPAGHPAVTRVPATK